MKRENLIFAEALICFVAVLAMSMKVNADITGIPVKEQLRTAITTSDIDKPVRVLPKPEPEAEPVAADPLKEDKALVAKMVWGEARGCSKTEQAAVVWCVLNRFESGNPYYKDCKTIGDIVTQEDQFVGYHPDNPVEPEIAAVVEDVFARWQQETVTGGDVGRVLPEDYLWFHGDGTANHFRNAYEGGAVWDWSMPSPYED